MQPSLSAMLEAISDSGDPTTVREQFVCEAFSPDVIDDMVRALVRLAVVRNDEDMLTLTVHGAALHRELQQLSTRRAFTRRWNKPEYPREPAFPMKLNAVEAERVRLREQQRIDWIRARTKSRRNNKLSRLFSGEILERLKALAS